MESEPGKIRVTTELCQEVMPPEESDIRPFSDDQNIVIGYACGDERTNYLPAAHWISGETRTPALCATAERRGSLRDLRT